jgi:hypothetical protein
MKDKLQKVFLFGTDDKAEREGSAVQKLSLNY